MHPGGQLRAVDQPDRGHLEENGQGSAPQQEGVPGHICICCLYVVYYTLCTVPLSQPYSLFTHARTHTHTHTQIFMGNYSSLVGAATFIIIFFGSNVVKHLGWRCVCLMCLRHIYVQCIYEWMGLYVCAVYISMDRSIYVCIVYMNG